MTVTRNSMKDMLRGAHRNRRDVEREELERRRYDWLERIYLLTDADCERGIDARELATEFGITAGAEGSITEDLMRLGFLRRSGPPNSLCLTRRGLDYLQKAAWRRRTIRDA